MQQPRRRRRHLISWAGAVAAVAVAAAAVWFVVNKRAERDLAQAEPSRIMIAVMPFENLGPTGDEYFADGITEEINGRLAAVSELGVISRTSTRRYKDARLPAKEVARELGVDYVLEGTVRWDRSGGVDRVLITPQLVRAADDVYVWSDHYDRELGDLFRVQSEIASRVIEKLDVTLVADARERVESHPTGSFEAYQAYLQGVESTRTADYNEDAWRLGLSMFERAVDLDPGFALAHAELSRLHSRGYHLGFDRSPERLALAEAAASRAAELDPGLNETRLAAAYFHYWGRKDYRAALEALDAAEATTRNNPDFLEVRGYILRRQGESRRAADSLTRAFELSPRDPGLAVEIANTYLGMWQFERARELYDLAISMAPDVSGPYTLKVRNQYLWDGDLEAAGRILAEIPAGQSTRVIWFRAFHELLAGRPEATLEQLEPHRDDTYQTHAQTIPLAMVIGWAYEQQGRTGPARQAFGEALVSLEQALEERPDDFRILMAMGLAHAGLDDRETAIRFADEAVQLYPISKDAWAGPIVARNRVLVLTRVGEPEAALDQVEELLSEPNPGASPALFRIDPRLAELRRHPRFDEVLAGAAKPALWE